MQCASCSFENMPGITVCGRCGARLELATVSIDVHPPRARPAVKRLRRWFPWTGLIVRLRDAIAALARAASPDAEALQVASGVFPRMVVPGWPQWFTGQALRGRILLATYCGLLLPGVVFIGTPLGSVLLGLAISAHAASVIDIVWAGTRDLRARVTCAVLCLAVVGTVVYFPVTWAVTRVAVPRRLMMDAAPFATGDVVLYNPSAFWLSEPVPGDVVLYRIVPRQVQARSPQGYNMVYRIEGEFIDRVLAGPGQSVQWESGKLLVDGQPSPWLPLHPPSVREKLQLTVPPSHYLVLPSTVPYNAPAYPAGVWSGLSIVPRQSVLGRVFLRHQPLTRLWWIR